ncbi:hypothetical protein ERJ75_000727900 [Trypanosoma vivax]|nr:hypothetical protein ERJ75_000727900 [Trypanosoma vivax]
MLTRTFPKSAVQMHSACSVASSNFNYNTSYFQTTLEGEQFYREECQKNGVGVNGSFLKQIINGSSFINFDHGYLGERGILPIVATLQRMRAVSLSMQGCMLSTEDICLLCNALYTHKTLQKIDLRGVCLSVSSARNLLTLAIKNTGIVSILVDEDTPKYMYIQRQCFSNANITLVSMQCLVCNKSVIYSNDQRMESALLLQLSEQFMYTNVDEGEVSIQIVFRCLLACFEAYDGVLFLCSSECRDQLAEDIISALKGLVDEWRHGVKAKQPKNTIIAHCLSESFSMLTKLHEERREELLRRDASRHRPPLGPCDDDDDCDIISEDSEDSEMQKMWGTEQCTICGKDAVCLRDGAHRIMKQIHDDVTADAYLKPSAFLHLTKIMVEHKKLRPCSQDCVEHIVRFALYGYGGVQMTSGRIGSAQVSTLGVPLNTLPIDDFAIINFTSAHIDDLGEEDTCCALTVASAMSDIEGVPIDPCMIFAVGRFLAKLPMTAIGMELRHACEAVLLVGCLPSSQAPFDWRRSNPKRDSYLPWEKWSDLTDTEEIVRAAFSRRRQGVFIVDGPHSNLFDNTRAALWAFRDQRRAVLVVMQFCMEWLSLPNGVVPNESSMKCGFLTTLKVVGQSNINNTFHVICQTNFGQRVGNRGFFYIPRGIFNLYVKDSGYMFLDASVYTMYKGERLALQASCMLPEHSIALVEHTALLHEFFQYCDDIFAWSRRDGFKDTKFFTEIFCHPPSPLFLAYRSGCQNISDGERGLLEMLRRLCLTDACRSLLLFYINEVLGPDVVEWIQRLVTHLSDVPSLPIQLQKVADYNSLTCCDFGRSGIRWMRVLVPIAPSHPSPLRRVRSARINPKGLLYQQRKQPKEKARGEVKDIFRDYMDLLWSNMRKQQTIAQRAAREEPEKEECLPAPLLTNSTSRTFTSSQMLEGKRVPNPADFVGERWHCVRLCNERGELSDYVMLFIKSHVCCYNLESSTVTTPLQLMSEYVSLRNFPFIHGFDCVFNSPVNPRIAYFFSGEKWLEWDTYRQRCTGGLCKLQYHKQFSALPRVFAHGISAALPVPETSLVLLFSQLVYIVFDLSQQRPVTDVLRIGSHVPPDCGLPTFFPELAGVFPIGPMATLLLHSNEVMLQGHQQCGTKVSPPCEIVEGRQSPSGIVVVNEHQTNESGADEKRTIVMLVGQCGRVSIVNEFTPGCVVFQTLPSSILARLPAPLLQFTVVSLGATCRRRIDEECSRVGVLLSSSQSTPIEPCSISSNLSQREENEIKAVHAFTCPPEFSDAGKLICDEVVFLQTEQSLLEEPPQWIEMVYDSGRPPAFGALVTVVDLSCVEQRILRLAPIEAVAESSDDGVTYVRKAHFSIASSVTAVCWGESHVAYVWRMRFLTKLPIGCGVARLFWHEVTRILRTVPLNPIIQMEPRDSTRVSIQAPSLFCSPKELLNCLSPGAVFTSPTALGWMEPHCILPILPGGNFALVFCGTNFVELNCTQGTVATHRSVPLARHPAFAQLPLPFSRGFNAVFYTDTEHPHIVALLHGKDIILWNIHEGLPAVEGNSDVSTLLFDGLPWKLEEVDHVVQIWDHINEVFVVKGAQVLRWNFSTRKVIEGPTPLNLCPPLYHAEFSNKQILCIASFPSTPKRFYVFSEGLVAAQTVIGDDIEDRMPPMPVSCSELFNSMTWYLQWGKRRYDSEIYVDFVGEHPLFVGIIMRSSEPCDDQWLVECSDDGVKWKTVCLHSQTSGCSRTVWDVEGIEHCSHRIWRLTLHTRKNACQQMDTVLYSNLTFLTLPFTPYSVLPEQISHSGTLNGPISSLLLNEKASVVFDNVSHEEEGDSLARHHVTIDYGDNNSPDLMAFSCQYPEVLHTYKWSVWCSTDAVKWENCGTWSASVQNFKAAWNPRGPRRYWSLVLETKQRSILCYGLSVSEYSGPSISMIESPLSITSMSPFFLWAKTPGAHGMSPITFVAKVGMCITLDAKMSPAQVVGVRITSDKDDSSCTTFVVECSTNALDWRCVGGSLVLRGPSAQVAWEDADYCRYWRLRIVHHAGSPRVVIYGIFFDISKPSLYRALKVSEDVNGTGPVGELNLDARPTEVVAVEAYLPPSSSFVVEKLSLDGFSWEEITTLRNKDAVYSKTVRQGWVPQGSSSHWRLRPTSEGVSSECSSAREESKSMRAQLQALGSAHVEWFAFTGKALVQSTFTGTAKVEIATMGFVHLKEPKCLLENKLDTSVLQSDPMEKFASVSWYFGESVLPRFKQVFIRGYTTVRSKKDLELLFESLPGDVSPPVPQVNSKKSAKKGSKKVVNTPEVSVREPNVEEKEEPLTIVVETSENGVDYVPIAEGSFSHEGSSLSWRTSSGYSYWRIRFKGLSRTKQLDLQEVRWLSEKGITSVMMPQTAFKLSNLMYETWQSSAFSHEKEFRQRCREGFDQSRSVASGFRDPGDIERRGWIAEYFRGYRKEFGAFVEKIPKDIATQLHAADGMFISFGGTPKNDFMCLLHMLSQRYGCKVDKLNQLIASPMLVGKDLAMEKEGPVWFYPKFEHGGTLMESFYGFHNVRAFLNVFWSMSLQLQRNANLLKKDSMNLMSPHVASVVVVVEIRTIGWMAAEHFPNLPLLYHVGFSGEPIIIAFTLNNISFTPRYRLTIPGSNPLPCTYPMTLFAGINFVQRTVLTSCPCPIFERLQMLYPKEFLEESKTEIVFVTPTMNSRNAVVRFTLPGGSVNLGVRGLRIGSIEFEVHLQMEKIEMADEVVGDVPVSSHRMMFVTHGAFFEIMEKPGCRTELALAGSVSNNEDKITMSGISPSGRYDIGNIFPDAFITDLNISFEAVVGSEKLKFLEPSITLNGTLVAPACGSFACRLQRASLGGTFESILIQIVDMQLSDFIRLSDYLVSFPSRSEEINWMRAVPIFLTLGLQLNYPDNKLMGHGSIEFAGVEGDTAVILSKKGKGISSRFKTIRIGGIVMQGKTEEDSVVMSISSSANNPLTVRLDGYSSLFAPHPYPTKVEFSHEGVLCVSTGVFYNVCIEEKSVFPSGMYAQVMVSRKLLSDTLSEELQRLPMVVALLSKSVHFCFEVNEVLVNECILSRRIMFLTVRGMFLGCYFDVTIPVVSPDNTEEEARAVCEALIPHIVEQCDEPLWTLYQMVSGCTDNADPLSPGGTSALNQDEVEEGDPLLLSRDKGNCSCRCRTPVSEGQFLAQWSERELEMFSDELKTGLGSRVERAFQS